MAVNKFLFPLFLSFFLSVATVQSYFVLKYNAAAVAAATEATDDDGIEGAFDVENEVDDVVQTGVWIGDCFIYTTASNRLQYYAREKKK